MKNWIKRNWIAFIAIIALVLSIGSVCLSAVRIEPIDFNNGSLLAVVFGSMGLCTTIMVASQIMGLWFSESKVMSMLTHEVDKLRWELQKSSIAALFKVGVRAALDSSERQQWTHFMTDIDLLVSYVMELKEPQKAKEVARILCDAEIGFRFYDGLLKEQQEHLLENIWKLIRLMDDKPIELMMLFNVLKSDKR